MTMKILANENFPGSAVEALRQHGHDVAWVRTDSPGIADPEVMARAAAETRLLVTFDKDFGELAFRERQFAAAGIVLFRVIPDSPAWIADFATSVLESRSDWAGHFSVVEERRVRMTPLPKMR